MPQAMALSGCQHHTSLFPCRRCLVPKGEPLGDAEFDIVTHRRTSQSIVHSRDQNGIGRGIGQASPFEDPELAFDVTTGIPTEPMHSELGYAKTIMGYLFEALTGKYRNKLNNRLLGKRKLWPWTFRKIKLSKEGKISSSFTEASRFVQISCFLLVEIKATPGRENMLVKDWLKPSMFSKKSGIELTSRLGKSFCKEIRKCFTLLAASNALVFAEARGSDPSNLEHMANTIKSARKQIKKVWSTMNIPNAHTGLHLVESADNYALATNANVSRFEARHAPCKNVASNSNNVHLEKQIIRDNQAQDAIRFIAANPLIDNPNNHNNSGQYLTIEAKRLICRPDSTVSSLLRARMRVDSSYVSEPGEDVVQLAIIFKKPMVPGRQLDAEDQKVIPISFAGIIPFWYRIIIRPGVEPYRARVCVGDYWEVISAPASGVMPTGPRKKVSIVRISGIIQIGALAFIQPLWLVRSSPRPHEITRCFKYQLAMRFARFPKLLSENLLLNKVHLYECADTLFHNPFFLK